jgi:Superfamily II DNA/RNA helicases, SNF2 family
MTQPTSHDIAAQLAAMKSEYDALKSQYEPMELSVKELTRKSRDIYKQWQDMERERSRLRSELDDLKFNSAKYPGEIERLERQLRLAQMAETQLAKNNEAIETFKAKCLAASWRSENRSDGNGAMHHQIDGGFTLALTAQYPNGGGYCFDKRGLGKTLTSLIVSDLIDASKLVIFVPNDVASQYAKEIARWTPHRAVIPFFQLTASQRDMWYTVLKSTAQWTIVMNYEAWRKDFSVIEEISKLQPTCIIEDEAHMINKTAMRAWRGIWYLRSTPNKCPVCSHYDILHETKTHQVLCKMCGATGRFNPNGQFKKEMFEWLSVNFVLPMTGSPFLNRPQELYSLLRLVQPDEFFSEEEFLRTYCAHIKGSRWTWRYGGYEALVRKIKDRLVLRDRKTAGVEIPPQEVQIHELYLDAEKYPEQVRALEQIRQYAQLVMDSAGETVMNMTIFLEVLLRLRQGITWPAGIKLHVEDKEHGDYDKYLEVNESIKIDWTMEMVKQLVDEGERVLVFSHFAAPLEEFNKRLNQEGISNVLYYGKTPYSVKLEAKDDFDPNTCGPNPRYSVMLGHYASAGTGLNLNAASQLIMLDREWSPGKEGQAMGRIDRIGTSKATTVHIPHIVNSVADNFMMRLINEKLESNEQFDNSAKQLSILRDSLDNKDWM